MPEWLYGRHAVEETIRAGRRKVFRVLVASDGGEGRSGGRSGEANSIEARARQARILVERAPAARLDALTRAGRHHQGVAAEVGPFPYSSLAEVVAMCRSEGERSLVLVLDSLQDPQNFGTLLRTSEAAAVTAVVILDRRQVEITPAVVNASAGAVEHVKVCQVNNLTRAIEALQEAGLWVYALQAEEGAVALPQADLKGATGLVVGSEGQGVGRLVRERCDGALMIPMRGRVESLNAAVAGSIALYEAMRQRA